MLKKVLLLTSFVAFGACSVQRQPIFWQESVFSDSVSQQVVPTVAIVLPLTGEYAEAGKHLQNAALQAVFDHKDVKMKTLFFDTMSTQKGAEQAYDWAVAQKPDVVLGPIFSQEVAAIQDGGVSVPLLTFTSDTQLVNDKVGTMAVTVADQVRQMVRYACAVGQFRLGVLASDSRIGAIAKEALNDALADCPAMRLEKVSLYDAETMNFTNAVKRLLPEEIDADKPDLTEEEQLELAKPMTERAGLDAIFIFEEGVKLRQILSLMPFYDAGPKDIPLYALTVVKSINDANANGVYFADLDASGFNSFAQNYKSAFGEQPIRIASQMYDAMGLVFDVAEQGVPVSLDNLRLVGAFDGVDGEVRLNPDGTNQRPLQLMQKKMRGATPVVMPEFMPLSEAHNPWGDFIQPITE